MENRVPLRLFNNLSILCVSPDFLPGKQGRRVSPFIPFTYPSLCR